MTNATHTPGPWRVFDVFADLEIVTDRPTANETESLVQFKGQRNAKADARLMAAAPDLLFALEALFEYASDCMPDELDGTLEVWTQARAAIDKVRAA